MSQDIAIPQANTRLLLHLVNWFRTKTKPAEPQDAILRLAETSPHLLADIGYQLDRDLSNPREEVWCRRHQKLIVKTEMETLRYFVGR